MVTENDWIGFSNAIFIPVGNSTYNENNPIIINESNNQAKIIYQVYTHKPRLSYDILRLPYDILRIYI